MPSIVISVSQRTRERQFPVKSYSLITLATLKPRAITDNPVILHTANTETYDIPRKKMTALVTHAVSYAEKLEAETMLVPATNTNGERAA